MAEENTEGSNENIVDNSEPANEKKPGKEKEKKTGRALCCSIFPGCRRTADTGPSVSRDGGAVCARDSPRTFPVQDRAFPSPARRRHWMTQHVAFVAPPPCPRSSLAIDVGE